MAAGCVLCSSVYANVCFLLLFGNCSSVFAGQTTPGDCVDYGGDSCPIWAKQGECIKNMLWMKNNCAKSCNVCSTASAKDQPINNDPREKYLPVKSSTKDKQTQAEMKSTDTYGDTRSEEISSGSKHYGVNGTDSADVLYKQFELSLASQNITDSPALVKSKLQSDSKHTAAYVGSAEHLATQPRLTNDIKESNSVNSKETSGWTVVQSGPPGSIEESHAKEIAGHTVTQLGSSGDINNSYANNMTRIAEQTTMQHVPLGASKELHTNNVEAAVGQIAMQPGTPGVVGESHAIKSEGATGHSLEQLGPPGTIKELHATNVGGTVGPTARQLVPSGAIKESHANNAEETAGQTAMQPGSSYVIGSPGVIKETHAIKSERTTGQTMAQLGQSGTMKKSHANIAEETAGQPAMQLAQRVASTIVKSTTTSTISTNTRKVTTSVENHIDTDIHKTVSSYSEQNINMKLGDRDSRGKNNKNFQGHEQSYLIGTELASDQVHDKIKGHVAGQGKGTIGGVSVASSSHFMAYFVTCGVLVAVLYLLYHNKQKLFAYILEGKDMRHSRNGRYRKVASNVEDAMPSLDKAPPKDYVY